MIEIDYQTRTLRIFDRFQIDRNLPKHKKQVKMEQSQSVNGFIANIQPQYGTLSSNFVWNRGQERFIDSSDAIALQLGRQRIQKNKKGIRGLISNVFPFLFKTVKEQDAHKAFEVVFSSAQELKIFQDRQQAFDLLIKDAKCNGQTALVESLTEQRDMRIRQNQLFSTGFNTFLSQKSMVDVAIASQKGLRLDWIKNFTRHLPKDVNQKKKKADALKIFDNYVILHYDPQNKSNKLTVAQLNKKKDPILFGVMSNSRKLYFVADWIDEQCNLTFEQLLKIAQTNNVNVGQTKIS